MNLIIISAFAFASNLQGEEIWTAPEPIQNEQPTLNIDKKKISQKPNTNFRSINMNSANIPTEYIISLPRESNASELIQPPKGSVEIFRGIKVGDIVEVNVPHSVIAFPDEKAPVVGSADQGQFRGFKFIGESYLERNSKRIFINIYRLVIGQQIFDIKGVGVSSQGQPGLIGKNHSREAEYFAGDFIASFAAGYFDGLIPRKTNVFGQIETQSSVDSAVKKGLANGALSTADRFRDKLKKVPEFSEIKGPFNLKILILEQAKINN